MRQKINSANRTWANSLGEYLNGKTGINQLHPRQQLFDDIGMRNILDGNNQYNLVFTLAEARQAIDELSKKTVAPSTGVSAPEDFARGMGEQTQAMTRELLFSRGLSEADAVNYVLDKATVYSGSIHDSRGLYDVLMEFKSFGIKAKIFIAANGAKFIHISGYAGVRKIMTGTRYGATNPQILEMGIGMAGIANGVKSGAKCCIIVSVGYRLLEWIFRDDYTLANFIVNIGTDLLKLAIGAVVSLVVGAIITSSVIAGSSVMAVAIGLFALGFAVTFSLNLLDNEYQFSNRVITALKKAISTKPRTPEMNFQNILSHRFGFR